MIRQRRGRDIETRFFFFFFISLTLRKIDEIFLFEDFFELLNELTHTHERVVVAFGFVVIQQRQNGNLHNLFDQNQASEFNNIKRDKFACDWVVEEEDKYFKAVFDEFLTAFWGFFMELFDEGDFFGCFWIRRDFYVKLTFLEFF